MENTAKQENKFTIPMSTLNDNMFNQAMQKLSMVPFPGKITYNIRRINYIFAREYKKAQGMFGDLMEKYGEKDEKGRIVGVKKEMQEEFKKANDEMMKTEVSLDKCQRISFEDLCKCSPADLQLAAFELEALEPVLCDLDFSDLEDDKKEETEKPKLSAVKQEGAAI